MAHPLTGDDDFCTELLSLEHDFQQQGFAEGLAIGERLGFLEGYSLGCNKGSEIGAELGFCLGCVRVWRSILQHAGSEVYSQRASSVLSRLNDKIDNFSFDPSAPDFSDSLESIRALFRQATSLMGSAPRVVRDAVDF